MHIITWHIDELANCCCTNTEARKPCTRDKPHWRWDDVRMMGLSYSQSQFDHMLPSRNDVHRHRVEAATCIPRSEDRNRLVAFTNQILPSRDDVHRHRVLTARCTLRGEDRNRLVAYTKQTLPTSDDVHRHRVVAATCTHKGEDRNRLVAFTRTYAAQQGRCAQTPYGGSRTHTQRRRSQSHGAVPKWLIRLANPLRFSGPARPRDDKKNKRIK